LKIRDIQTQEKHRKAVRLSFNVLVDIIPLYTSLCNLTDFLLLSTTVQKQALAVQMAELVKKTLANTHAYNGLATRKKSTLKYQPAVLG